MSRLEKPFPEAIRQIYYVLVKNPNSFEQLISKTRLDRNTLALALNFLKEQGMIVSYNFSNRKMFRMVRTQPPRYGWDLPWLDFMMTKSDWKRAWRSVISKKKHVISPVEESNNRFNRLLEELLVEPNLDLVELLDDLGMTKAPLEVLRLHNQEPYCLDCLRKERRFVRMILCEESEEHCCPNCGVVRETLLVKRR